LPKTSIEDLLDAVRAVTYLKDTVAEHEQQIQTIITRLARIEAAIDALPKPRRRAAAKR
jgi:hypothetical protein